MRSCRFSAKLAIVCDRHKQHKPTASRSQRNDGPSSYQSSFPEAIKCVALSYVRDECLSCRKTSVVESPRQVYQRTALRCHRLGLLFETL